MKPQDILIALWADGILVRLTPDGKNLTVPAGRLTPGQRDLVLTHKPELIAFLVAAHTTTTALIEAALRRCDQFNDGPPAREQMRQDCLALPPHLQADLLEHFQGKPADLALKFQPAIILQIQKESHHD